MFKLIFLAIAAIGIIFFTPVGRGTRMAIDNRINPITKIGKVLGASTDKVSKIQDLVDSGKLGDIPEDALAELDSLLSDTQDNLDEAIELANKGDAIAAIGGAVSSIIPAKAPICTP
jgi:hypothetical protein